MSKKKGILAVIIASAIGQIVFIISILKKAERSEEVIDIDIPEDERDSFAVTFAGGAKYVNTENFKYSYLKARFGGMEVYYDNATLHEGKGIIDMDIAFGGVDLYIPKEWTVENNLNVLFGGVDFKGEAKEDMINTITLTGNINCGAVEIHYV